MQGREFLTLAEKLAAHLSPAERRSAISRSYYAAYHEALSFVISLGDLKVPESANAHEQVRRLLNNAGDIALKDAASILSSLRLQRNRSDYELARSDVEKGTVARQWVNRSDAAIKFIDSVPSEGRDDIRSAMKAWQDNFGT